MTIENMTADERSRRASEMLDDPFLNYVLDRLELKYIDAWRTSNYQDFETRSEAYERLNALHEFRADLELIATESAINAFNRRSREVI
jgi:hypothetical protein